MNDCLIIGVGNPQRGDDGVGLAAARLVRAALPEADVRESSGDPADLIELWTTARVPTVYVIDAMVSGGAPGSVTRFDAHRHPMPVAMNGTSTHKFGVAAAVELARVLDCLPNQLFVYGIEGGQFDHAERLSPEVEAAAREVAQLICANPR